MQAITIHIKPFPIFHSEYIQNVFDYAGLSSDDKRLYDDAKFALLQLVTVDVPDDLIEFFIGDKKFSPSLVQSISFPKLLEDIKTNQIRTHISSETPGILDCEEESVTVPAKEEVITRLQRVSQLANNGPYPEFYYYQIPITGDELFDLHSGVAPSTSIDPSS